MRKLIGPFSQLLPLSGLPLKGAIKDEKLEVVRDGGLLINNGIIEKADQFQTLLKNRSADTEIIEVKGRKTVLPGFIDVHTHLCYAGSRAQDFAFRIAGKSYLEIAEAGGGIKDSVGKTRKASQQELEELLAKRVTKIISQGVTTCEVKSGYGLSIEEELKILRAIQNQSSKSKIHLISTCLAAHVRPVEFNTNKDYLDYIIEKLFPVLKSENLTNRIDIFIEKSAFTAEEGEDYLTKAKAAGFDTTVHADQFTASGSKVAVKMKSASADHLEASGDEEIKMLAKSEVVSVVLPGASIGLGMQFSPARKLLNAGACVAIASDWNPGSAPMGNLLLQASVIATFEKLSTAEVLSGVTFRAAQALKLNDRGQLEKGKLADYVVFDTDDYREILYQQGNLMPEETWKKGEKIY
jgi:imidazolonepropionase